AQCAAPVAADGFTVDFYPALSRQNPGENFEQGRFAGAIGAQDAEHLAFLNRERDAVEHTFVFVGECQVVGLNRNAHRAAFFLPSRYSRKRKNGPPKNAVIIPTGSSAGASKTRARVSAQAKKIPPARKEAGSKRR